MTPIERALAQAHKIQAANRNLERITAMTKVGGGTSK